MFKRLIFVLILIMVFMYYDKEDTLVFKEIDNDYHLYTLEIENLNTKNFIDYFKDDRVLKIYPKNNPIYKNNISSYTFNSMNSNSYNIDRFIKKYLNEVDKYYNEKEKYMMGGIPIERVLIYTNKDKINKLKNKITIIK